MEVEREQEHRKRLDLEEEIARLEEILDEEQKLNAVLQCATYGQRCHIKSMPPQVQVLLEEITAVEEEIIFLERKVEELKLNLYEGKHANEFKLKILHSLGRLPQPREFDLSRSRLIDKDHLFTWQRQNGRRFSLKSSSFHSSKSRGTDSEEDETTRSKDDEHIVSKRHLIIEEKCGHDSTPNKLSEELLQGLITIFLKLNQTERMTLGSSQYGSVPKLTLSCMSSKSFISKASIINCKASTFHSRLDPYGLFHDLDATSHVHAIPYKKFVACTRSSLDMTQLSHSCLPEIERIRLLLRRYCSLDLSLLTYKQKLAFWINTYNACILHAFMQNGLPTTPEKLLALINKAALNVGGIVLNALAIEHFILRHPCDPQNVMDEKEAILRHVYGLGYPEPNVTFALCRGSWSSPALRVYTAGEVVTELERAKVEYLEAAVGITCKKKIVVPKLMHWHMHDFADNEESLLEWIYSQLPRSGPLKRSIMECLNGDSKIPVAKVIEVQPFDSEFRYLLPMLAGYTSNI